MKNFALAAGLALLAGGCVPTTYETLAVSCTDYIGQPITGRIAAWGPPKIVRRMTPTQVGYVFETKETSYIGGEPYYTVNYLIGSERHRRPVHRVTTTCKGVFVVQASSEATPISQRIIVDVVPAY